MKASADVRSFSIDVEVPVSLVQDIFSGVRSDNALLFLICISLVLGISMRAVGLALGDEIRDSIYVYNQIVLVISSILCGILIVVLSEKKKLPLHTMFGTVSFSIGSSLVCIYEFLKLGDLLSFSWRKVQSNMLQGFESLLSLKLSTQVVIILGMVVGGLALSLWYSFFLDERGDGPLKRAYNKLAIVTDNIIWYALLLIGIGTLAIFTPFSGAPFGELSLFEILKNIILSPLTVPLIAIFFNTFEGFWNNFSKRWSPMLDLVTIIYVEIAVLMGIALYEYKPFSMHILISSGFLGAVTGLWFASIRLAHLRYMRSSRRKVSSRSFYRQTDDAPFAWRLVKSAVFAVKSVVLGPETDQDYYSERIASVRILVIMLFTIYILLILGVTFQGPQWFTKLFENKYLGTIGDFFSRMLSAISSPIFSNANVLHRIMGIGDFAQ